MTHALPAYAIVIALAIGLPARAQNVPLEGFGDVKLGMPFKQLEATHQLKDKTVIAEFEGDILRIQRMYNPSAEVVYNDAATETLRGQTVNIAYGIMNDIVQQIALWIAGPPDPAGCARMVDDYAPIFADKCGKLDDAPTQSVAFTTNYLTVTRTATSKSWPDRTLAIGAYHWQSSDSSNCWLVVDYLLAMGGNAANKI
jgi:hypothetical protein